MSELVEIEKIIRRMRGKSRSFLALGSDQHLYVVKQCGDMWRNRRLVNECLGHSVFQALGVTIPDVRVVHIRDAEALHRSADGLGIGISEGFHLGSRLPRDPNHSTIFDFIPAKLLSRVCNLNEFATVFATDVWLCNASNRQQAFVHDNANEGFRKLKAYFIDNDEILCGAKWRIDQSHVDMRFRDTKFLGHLPSRDLCFRAVQAIAELDMRLILLHTLALSHQWLSSEEYPTFIERVRHLDHTRADLRQQLDDVLTACSMITSIASGAFFPLEATLPC